MKEKIGEIAGEIWNTLREKEEVNITQLPKVLKEKNTAVYMALGWLAREDKIEYCVEGDKIFVALNETEIPA